MSGASWSFLIAAGGSGTRLGGTPKQFRMLGGRPVWRWSFDLADSMRKKGLIKDITLVLPKEKMNEFIGTAQKLKLNIAEGGETRALSVLSGLEKCSGSHVLVHDGARPFISETLCAALMREAEEAGAAVPLLPCADAIKKIECGRISCADRDLYFRTQTPQAFDMQELKSVLKAAGPDMKDEAGAWIDAGKKIAHVSGEEINFKITTPYDWRAAKSTAEGCLERRTGHGYDIHQLAEGRKLVLAGMEVPDVSYGLLGHSDADIVAHTVMDALLGAAGEPDIGTLFPAADEKWRGADSMLLLARVMELLSSKGWRPEWIDATLNAQIPKLGRFIPGIIEKMNSALTTGTDERVFNLKVKSAEHCGSAGRGECMICHAVAQISRVRRFDAADV